MAQRPYGGPLIMQKLSKTAYKSLQKALKDDSGYAARNPKRKHWVRRAHFGEIPADAPTLSLPDGRWFTAVCQFGPGLRLRAFFEQDMHFDTDLPEAQARWVFGHVSGISV